MQQCVKAWVYGKVQGVGYRLFCKRKARELELKGYALNLEDGRVEVLVCGDDASIAKMVEFLHQGPAFSNVLGVDVEAHKIEVFNGFMTG